jgi:hypothetical protein
VSHTRIRLLITWTLVALLVLRPALHAQPAVTPDIWRAFTQSLEPGKTLKVRLKTGQRFRATLLQVIPDAIILQPKTRAAVPPQRVPFDQIETLEVDQGKGIGIGKAVAIGAGVGAGAWLALMAFAFAVLGD